MARFDLLILGISIGITLLCQPVFTTPGLAQTTRERCDALAAEKKGLEKAEELWIIKTMPVYHKNMRGLFIAKRTLEALEAASPDFLSALLSEDPFGTTGMRSFKEEHQLTNWLNTRIAAGKPMEFWRAAEMELQGRLEILNDAHLREVSQAGLRIQEILRQRLSLDCDLIAARVGPLPIPHNHAGLPIVTDELLTRWFRAYRAMQVGGAYWQAGQMTQQEFAEVNARVGAFTVAACRPEGRTREDGARDWLCRIDPVRATLEQGFSAEELTVLQARQTEMEAALSGNWSAVRM